LGTTVSTKVGREGVTLEAMTPQRGSVTPSLIDGRLPTGLDEIALGSETMNDLHKHFGSTVVVHGETRDFHMRVVGRIAMPNLFYTFSRPGQGGATTLPAAELIAPHQAHGGGAIYARFAPGVSQQAFFAKVRRTVPDLFVVPQQQSSQLSSLHEIGGVP